jgi:ABC-type Na+ transport system ATPase subunit NatA
MRNLGRTGRVSWWECTPSIGRDERWELGKGSDASHMGMPKPYCPKIGIGIARAFLKDAPILILDEATSALDTESEMRIQQNIVELLEGRTVIAVAHRLSTLAAFDRILVVEDGRIAEEGSARELRQSGRLFERMWRLQADGLVLH